MAVIALQVAVVYVSPLQSLLDTAPLAPMDWLIAAGVASSVLVLDELRKLVMRGMRGGGRERPRAESRASGRVDEPRRVDEPPAPAR